MAKFQWIGTKLGFITKEKSIEEDLDEYEDVGKAADDTMGTDDHTRSKDFPVVHHGPPDASEKKHMM